ncbi:MAG: dockerin type I repeat-containing protein [Clostridia bacterium]|nr:dockerin type I repeat-containing protein [Clostridia bacterium]
MKKAKQLLAVLLAAIMIFSVAVVPGYATNLSSDNFRQPNESKGFYWFTYEQSCGYVLDLLDNLLKEGNLTMTCDELNDMANIGLNIFTSNMMLNLDDKLADAGNPKGLLDFRSVDGVIRTLSGVLDCLDNNWLVGFADGVGLLGDVLDSSKGLNGTGYDVSLQRQYNTVTDKETFEMLINWVCNQKNLFRAVVGGTFKWGSILEGLIGDLITGFLPGSSLDNLGVGIKNLLYTKLVDDTLETIPSGETIDTGVQKLVNWALIEGTGTSAAEGAASLLGENHTPLMPAIGEQPGGAGLYASSIQADRDGDGALETHTMSFYQLVNNVLQALLDGMLGDLLLDLLLGLIDAEVTEQFPYGDPSLMTDVMFNTILGAVEGLMVQNGAPEITYTEFENTYPIPKVQKLVDWFLMPGGGLETLIKIDYYGIHIQDAFMSLLNDVGRLAINLLPGLGLFADSMHLAYTADELNEVYYYTADKQIVSDPDAEGIVDQLYLTYETEELVYPASKSVTADGATVIDSYNYFATDLPLNTTDEKAANYMNPNYIRPYYVISTDSVFACIIKMALNDFIDGCYFPEWTTDIPSVLAYGLAALTVPILPENNYYARLDAYHELTQGGVAPADANGEAIEPLYYYVDKVYDGVQVRVPKAALDIISSYAAAQLNSILFIRDSKDELHTDTTLEQFAGEFLVWGFMNYFPALTGVETASGVNTTVARTWTADVNNFIGQVYSNWESRTISPEANWDAIYQLIDNTLLKLLPESWLPNLNGSFELINSVLLENLINFDLQGILNLLSVNTSADAELAKPAVTVVIRIIDRVLAAVFNDRGVLAPQNRSGVVLNGNVTNITTLDELLSTQVNGSPSNDSSLALLIYNLLNYIQLYAMDRSGGTLGVNGNASLLAVALPLIAQSSYERPADSVLTSAGMRAYKVEDLENYVKMFTDNVNAERYLSNLDEHTAEILTNGTSKVVRSTDGTVYELQLSDGSVWATFEDYSDANELRKTLNNCYIVSELVDEKTETYTYHLYKERDYLTTTAKANDTTDAAGDVTNYTDFKFSIMSNRAPFVSYDSDYRFFEFEDFTNGYRYQNAKKAIEDADEYASSYRSFATNDLPDAYKAWIMYTIECQLYNNDIYDRNGDGYSVKNESDGDYVAPTTDANGNQTDDGNPVDGYPSQPTAMLPLTISSATAFTIYDDMLGQNLTVYMGGDHEDAMTAANFEQIQLANDYAADRDNDRVFTVMETEMIVRAALGNMSFDITADENGSFHGSKNWSNLTAEDLTKIDNYCAGFGFTRVSETAEDGTVNNYIKHLAYAPIFNNITFIDGVTSNPVSYTEYQNTSAVKEKTEAQNLQLQVYKSYEAYAKALYSNRRSLYNKIDMIGFTHELAEADRARRLDPTMLNWLLDHTRSAYVNSTTNKRNKKLGTGLDANGNPIEVKVYTSSSYERFRRAYDYGQALTNAASAATLGAGFTQGQVTKAFYGILDAYQALIEYLGAADKTQLNAFIAIADTIIDDEFTYDETYGVEEAGLNNLIKILAEAKTMSADENYDAEQQGEVDVMAATLNQAIGLLVYKTAPTILPSEVTTGNGNIVNILQTSNVNNRIVGQVYGLEEGVGAVMDLVELVGMTLDSSVGNTVTITPSGRGMGTGAYYSGRVNNSEKFRYFAVVYGDLNGDARVDGTDASYLEYYMAIESANSSDMGSAVYEAADANHDGFVDGGDVAEIVNHYTFRGEINQLTHSTSEVVL